MLFLMNGLFNYFS